MEPFEQPYKRNPTLLGPLLSALLGVASLLLFRLITGPAAIFFGLASLRSWNRQRPEGKVGQRLAAIGMVLGVAGTLFGVISFIAMIVFRWNEESRLTICAEHLRHFGQAINEYEVDNNHVYPRAVVHFPDGAAALAPWSGPAYADRLSWMVPLLPYLEGEKKESELLVPAAIRDVMRVSDLREGWDSERNEKIRQYVLKKSLCPGHPDLNPSAPEPVTHYVGLSGLGADAAELPLSSLQAGFFGFERTLKLGQLSRGQSYTLLMTETALNNGPWVAGGAATVRGFSMDDQPLLGAGRAFGGDACAGH